MIVRRLTGLVSASLLFGLSLALGARGPGQQRWASASASDQAAVRLASVHDRPHSDESSPTDAPEDCCHLIGTCTSPPLAVEPADTNRFIAITQRITTKDILEPGTPALSVDTPPPKA
jgi:hypothetical protein